MGGRKSYKPGKFIGGSQPVKKATGNLKDYLDSKEVEKASKSAFSIYAEAKNPLKYTAFAEKLTPTLIRKYSELKSEKDDDSLKRKLSKSWSKVKGKNDISVPKEVDRVIIENAIKFIRGSKNG